MRNAAEYIPTPEEIAEACAKIRAGHLEAMKEKEEKEENRRLTRAEVLEIVDLRKVIPFGGREAEAVRLSGLRKMAVR